MIRFRCPQCAKTIKVPEEKAGARVRCPRCRERTVVPSATAADFAGSSVVASSEPAGQAKHATTPRDEAQFLFSGMRWWERAAAGLLAAVALGSLLVVIASFLSVGAAVAGVLSWAYVLFPVSLIVLSLLLHGRATGCPKCGRWWTRRKGESEFVDREVFDKAGVQYARSTYRTTYECGSCDHRWSLDHTEEYKDFIRDRTQRRP
jgi:DNA-directed RNA polymerase subunit RPC12/RpoP